MMAAGSNGDNSIAVEWFLKRCGSYVKDVIINLDQDEVVIGRGNNRDLKHSPGVSRQHAFFKKTSNGHWLVKDLCSTNGVYINRKKIAADCLEPIKESDIIGFGVADATSNDQFSFALCKRTKYELINRDNVEQELEDNCRETSSSPNRCPLQSKQNSKYEPNSDELIKNPLMLNASKIAHVEQKSKACYTEASNSSNIRPVESEPKSMYELDKIKPSMNPSKLNDSKETAQNPEIEIVKDIVLNRTYDADKLNCKVLIERCDEKVNHCFINSIEHKNLISSYNVSRINDCNKEDIQEISVDFNISLKTELEDSEDSDSLSKTRCKSTKKKIIISDTDNSDDTIIPQRRCKLYKRKSIVSSGESDSSCDEKLLKGKDCNKEDIQKNSFAFNILLKTELANKEDNIQFSKCKLSKKKIVISDTDDSDDDTIIPQKNYKLLKRKSFSSGENDFSCDEMLLKSAFPDTTDNTHQAELTSNSNVTKQENSLIPHTSSDEKLEENQYSQLEVHNTHSVQCNLQPVENSSIGITNSCSKEDKVEPEHEQEFACMGKKELSDLHTAINSVTISDKLPLDNTVKSKVAECNNKSMTNLLNLDDCVLPMEATEKDNLSETRTKLTSNMLNSDNVIVLDDDNFSYSQNDAIIIISDDEDLLAVKQGPNEFLNIKKECVDLIKKRPIDNEVSCIWQKCESEKPIAQQNDVYDTDMKEDIQCNDDDMPVCETADDIFDFGNDMPNVDEKELFGRITWPPTPEDMDKEITENDFFPNLSQSFFSDDSSSRTSSDADMKQMNNESESRTTRTSSDVTKQMNNESESKTTRTSSDVDMKQMNNESESRTTRTSSDVDMKQMNNESESGTTRTSSDVDMKQTNNESENKTNDVPPHKNKSLGNKCHTSSVQPIEALPMNYRPKYTRGREEWFIERTGGGSHNVAINGITATNTDTTSEASRKKFYGRTMDKKQPPKVSVPSTGRKKKSPSLKQRLKENMGHRLRCPGGGSAIIKQDTTNSVRVVSCNTATKPKLNTQWSQCISDTAKRLPSSTNNVCSSSKPKTVHNTQVLQRFPSRTEQLTKSMLVNNSCDDKQNCPQQNLTEKNDLTVKQKSSCKQNLIPHSRTKNQKRGNPFGNFRIPKKKASEQEQLPLNESNLYNPPDKTKKHLDKCKQIAPLNNMKPQVSISVCTNGAVNEFAKNKKYVKNSDQNQKKRVRFAEEIVPCVERKALLPIPKSAAPIKHIPVRNKSSALNVVTEQSLDSCTRNYISQENIIAKIVCWNINWLREQCETNWPPPVVNLNSLKKVAWQYVSADDHWNTYFDFLLLEIWQSVFQVWRESENKHTDHFAVINLQQFKDMMILTCQTAVSITRSKALTFMEGHLAIVELMLRTKNEATAMVTIFGYLCDCKMERYRIESAHPLLQTVPACTASSSCLVNFVLKIKYREDNVKISRLMKMKPILYLKPFLRQCEALQNMYDCPLQRCILFPQSKLCSFNGDSRSVLRSTATYNKMQKQAILGVAAAVLEPTEPRLLLLHGPPGTGKTHTIVGIIQQLLFHCVKNANQQVKLLVAAPSNAAVDEIGRRLLKLRSCLIASNGKKMRFVRVGQFDMVHKDLKMYFIDELVKLNLQNPNMEHDPGTTINHLQAKINKLQQEISSRQEHNPYDHVIARKQKELDCARKELIFYKSRSSRHGFVDEKQKYKLKIDILTKADIILSTLNSCRQGILESAFGKNSSVTFTCCIIDEATQCTEPEILIPFYYGMNKVVLVGDPQQLSATVFSRLAIQYGFQVSLFERLKNYFYDSPGDNPVFMLTDQYRMHPEICTYPSSYFYSGRLRSCGIGDHFLNFPLKRYLILDIIDGKECTDNRTKIYNRAEANFVEYLCSETLRLIPSSCTLGVITPYQGQRQIIRDYFQSTMSQEQHRLEVNTVDGFQGREHDVIILSCVRASSSGSIGFLDDRQRLNVAITRARYSLIICGHMASLRSYQLWGSLIRNAESRNLIFPVRSSSLEEVFDLLKATSIER